jgi:hypothetical protein
MKLLLTAATVVLVSTIALAQKVNYDFDKSANFSSFRTYAWAQGTHVNDELNHKRIVTAIDAQLAAKRFRKVGADEHPDVLVAYHASFDKDLQINASSVGWGPYGLGGGNRSGSARVQEVVVGTLVVAMMDARSSSVVWRGVASTDIDASASPQRRDRNTNKAAEKLFKNYPPKA